MPCPCVFQLFIVVSLGFFFLLKTVRGSGMPPLPSFGAPVPDLRGFATAGREEEAEAEEDSVDLTPASAFSMPGRRGSVSICVFVLVKR